MYMTVKKTASTYKTLTINAWNALVPVLKNTESHQKMYTGNCLRKPFSFLIETYILNFTS